MPRHSLGLHAYFLVGPTASGKTEVAQRIAEQWQADILSADSMQVYCGMDIGTAKYPPLARQGIEYHGIDRVDPGRAFTVAEYRVHALDVMRRNAERSRKTLVVGGTGLYVKSLTHGLAGATEPDPETRRRWNAVFESGGIQALQAALRERDPGGYAALRDPQNPRRIIRALERGPGGVNPQPGSWTLSRQAAPLAGLDVAVDVLKMRIESRVDAMYRAGLIAEVRRLLANAAGLSDTARQAIGYAEAVDVLEGRCSEAEARVRTVRRTAQLAKRQRTWFRHQEQVCWADAAREMGLVVRNVLEIWETHGPTEIVE